MTWLLERVQHEGADAIYAIAESDCGCRAFSGRYFGHGRKQPVLILVVKDGAIAGIDIAGNPVAEKDIERRFPGALDRIK